MSRGRDGLFRGSELPRMVLLLGVAVVGWIVVAFFANRPRHEPPAPRTAAELPPLPPPDGAEVLQLVHDKTFVTARDGPAYALLWRRAVETPPAELAKAARTDVRYSQLFDDPARYRGLPIHVEGTARRVLIHDDADPKVIPGRKMYEAYVYAPDSQNNPYVLAFRDAPRGLTVGDDLFERIAFDGYFFKQMLYRGGDGNIRFAPLLIGRLTHLPEATPGPGADTRARLWALSPLLLIVVYIAIRVAFHLRRGRRPARPIRTTPLPNDEIEPDALNAWLDTAADEDEPDGSDRDD